MGSALSSSPDKTCADVTPTQSERDEFIPKEVDSLSAEMQRTIDRCNVQKALWLSIAAKSEGFTPEEQKLLNEHIGWHRARMHIAYERFKKLASSPIAQQNLNKLRKWLPVGQFEMRLSAAEQRVYLGIEQGRFDEADALLAQSVMYKAGWWSELTQAIPLDSRKTR